uniref:Glycosyltransferase n=1 Tax=Aeromonas hydrophila TaxID=644 RepID=A0A346AC82_AERHY|nr:glycosyltransferase [Aeromonas hydrophila]
MMGRVTDNEHSNTMSATNMTVDILLATYNGERYLSEQIESILNQTFSNFTLYIRDDGSTDSTRDIIALYCAMDSRVKFILNDVGSNSVGRNFFELIKWSTAEYVFFSDQDDVWLSTKVERSLSKLISIQEPCLLYVNGEVVNESLERSSINVYKSDGLTSSFKNLLFYNGGVQGCATVVNRKLIDLVRDKENIHWYMHDQVLTFYAVAYGKVYFLNEVLFLYRQHSRNVIGYQNKGYISALISRLKGGAGGGNTLLHKPSLDFINSFYLSEGCKLKKQDDDLFKVFFRILSINKIIAIFFILSNSFTLKNSKIRLLIKSMFFKL